MRILVTGATGFIGAAFVRLARERGHQVAALARPETIRRLGARDSDDLCWLGGTLAEPPWPAIERFAPDHCLHAAWIAEPGVYLDSPLNDDYLRWSIALVRRLAEGGLLHAIGLGTCIEYKIDGKPARENRTPLEPISPYARAKDALRRTVEDDIARHAPHFSFCWGRVFYPYGPGEHPARLCSALARKLLAGETLLLKTPGSTKDYIFIDDLAAAILAIMERGLAGAINLGTGEGVAVREIARALGRLLGREHLVGESDQPGHDPLYYVVADAARLSGEAGWRPAWTLESGLAATIRR
jgi:nucleoside-diphosphate-sugar epimerase